jgi:hypothetical protein
MYRSTELGRFRNSKIRYRRCELCGFDNSISSGDSCVNRLLLVEYEMNDALWGQGNLSGDSRSASEATDDFLLRASEAGHGARGPGGHFQGRCLCSVDGCPPSSPCSGYKNALCEWRGGRFTPMGPNFALIPETAVADYNAGAVTWSVGQRVFVRHMPPQQESSTMTSAPTYDRGLLWKDGIMGGFGTIRSWKVRAWFSETEL